MPSRMCLRTLSLRARPSPFLLFGESNIPGRLDSGPRPPSTSGCSFNSASENTAPCARTCSGDHAGLRDRELDGLLLAGIGADGAVPSRTEKRILPPSNASLPERVHVSLVSSEVDGGVCYGGGFRYSALDGILPFQITRGEVKGVERVRILSSRLTAPDKC